MAHVRNKDIELVEMKVDLKYIREKIDDVCDSVKTNAVEIEANSDFRKQAYGIVIGIGAVFAVIVNASIWAFQNMKDYVKGLLN